ncbi:MAG: type II toxin-antitoxin system HicB family antitoxin [Eubacteriales bacterium]|nr:type II toxin-antitoxin system HicB family antitoxin [Eubacteriales bacterium]
MVSVYPAYFFKEKNGYSVVFPDLNFLSTCGTSLEEAMQMALDCLAGYLYTLQKEGGDAPSSSPLSAIYPNAIAAELEISDVSEAFVNMIAVDVAAYAKEHFEKSVKKTLTLPAWLNDRAAAAGINFSQTLQEALKQKLGCS